MLVGEVYPNTSAAVAGIHEGDRLLKWNGHDIGDVAAWMTQLSQHKPGDVVEVTVQRGKTADQTEVVPVTLRPAKPRTSKRRNTRTKQGPRGLNPGSCFFGSAFRARRRTQRRRRMRHRP